MIISGEASGELFYNLLRTDWIQIKSIVTGKFCMIDFPPYNEAEPPIVPLQSFPSHHTERFFRKVLGSSPALLGQ